MTTGIVSDLSHALVLTCDDCEWAATEEMTFSFLGHLSEIGLKVVRAADPVAVSGELPEPETLEQAKSQLSYLEGRRQIASADAVQFQQQLAAAQAELVAERDAKCRLIAQIADMMDAVETAHAEIERLRGGLNEEETK